MNVPEDQVGAADLPPNDGPLADYRVLDLGHVLAGPFAATLLGDFGAEVIKVERPGEGDPARSLGPQTEGESVWWKSLARNKRSLALDWTTPKGKKALERLVLNCHVLVESFRPGVLERHGLGPDTLLRWNPDLVILRISGYGQSGPYSARPGFGKAAEALSGVVHLTGLRGGAPMHVGFALGDMSSGLMGAYGVVMALLAIARGKAKGQVIDLPIYETPMRLLDYHIPVHTGSSFVPERNGNQQTLSLGLSGIFQSKDGRWITYTAATMPIIRRVLKLIGGAFLHDDPRFQSLAGASEHDTEINRHVAAWMAVRSAEEVVNAFGASQAVAAVVFDANDILNDPHIAARENIVSIRGESVKVVGVVPKLGATPGSVRWLGPSKIGQDSEYVLSVIAGMDETEIAALEENSASAA